MGDSQSHDTPVGRCDVGNYRAQSVGDGPSLSSKLPLRTADEVVGVPTATDLLPLTHPLSGLLTSLRPLGLITMVQSKFLYLF